MQIATAGRPLCAASRGRPRLLFYLALATFAIAVATPAVLRKPEELTGGSRGIQLFGLENLSGKGFERVDLFGRAVAFEDFVYYVTWMIAGALFVVAWLVGGGEARQGVSRRA